MDLGEGVSRFYMNLTMNNEREQEIQALPDMVGPLIGGLRTEGMRLASSNR